MADEEDYDYGEDYGPDEDEGSSGRGRKEMRKSTFLLIVIYIASIIAVTWIVEPEDFPFGLISIIQTRAPTPLTQIQINYIGILVIFAVLYFLLQYIVYPKFWQKICERRMEEDPAFRRKVIELEMKLEEDEERKREKRETSRWKVDDNGGMTLTGRSYRRMDYDGGYIYDQRDDDHEERDDDHPSYIS